uniref:Uncharacterized protein n=1 Tax=Arundo donax TaxID=35708 RepID=A0A0A8ZA55_ARUDO
MLTLANSNNGELYISLQKVMLSQKKTMEIV